MTTGVSLGEAIWSDGIRLPSLWAWLVFTDLAVAVCCTIPCTATPVGWEVLIGRHLQPTPEAPHSHKEPPCPFTSLPFTDQISFPNPALVERKIGFASNGSISCQDISLKATALSEAIRYVIQGVHGDAVIAHSDSLRCSPAGAHRGAQTGGGMGAKNLPNTTAAAQAQRLVQIGLPPLVVQ